MTMETTSPPRPYTPKFGINCMYPAPGIIERIGPDWDWIWIDGQHGQVAGYDTMLAMIRACNLIGRPAFVRVPSHESAWISLALDADADAVIVPQVESVAEAKAVVRAAKFPPLGNRSYGGRRPIDRHGRGFSNNANTERLLVCQIESEPALAAAADIAAVDGVDALFLGPDDMMLRKGLSMEQPRKPEMMAECVQQLTAACRASGKLSVTVAVGDETLALCLSHGVDYIVVGGDVPFLATMSQTTKKHAVEFAAGLAGAPAPSLKSLY